MNPTLLPPNSDSTSPRPRHRAAMPPPAFHSLRALIPRAPLRRIPIPACAETPSYETRAFPVELTYMS